MSQDRGNLTWARRQWGKRTSRAVARAQGRCSQCNRIDKTGLLEGKCTACFVAGPPAPVGYPNGPVPESPVLSLFPSPPAPTPTMNYLLIRNHGKPEAGPVVLPDAMMMQTACNLLAVSYLSQLETVASEPAYAVFAVANARDYARPNEEASRELARLTGQQWEGARQPYGPVLILTKA